MTDAEKVALLEGRIAVVKEGLQGEVANHKLKAAKWLKLQKEAVDFGDKNYCSGQRQREEDLQESAERILNLLNFSGDG